MKNLSHPQRNHNSLSIVISICLFIAGFSNLFQAKAQVIYSEQFNIDAGGFVSSTGSGSTFARTAAPNWVPNGGTAGTFRMAVPTAASNRWAISPGISLVAGNIYTFSWGARLSGTGSGSNNRHAVAVGTSQTAAAMTTVLYPLTNITTISYLPYTATSTFTPTISGTYYFGVQSVTSATGFAYYIDGVQVSQAASGMTYTSSTVATASTASVGVSSVNNEVLGINIITSGSTPALTLNTLSFSTNGTSIPVISNVSNAKLWKTSGSSFTSPTQVGSTVSSPNGAFAFSSLAETLIGGNNYFWLTYDIPGSASTGAVIDAECTGILIDAAISTPAPTPSSPTGNRTIVVPQCYRTAGSGNWNDLSTWQQQNACTGGWTAATAIPDFNAENVVISTGHTITMNAAVTADQLTVSSGAQLIINPAITFTLNNGSGDDLSVLGTFRNFGTINLLGGSSASISGIFDHARDGGTIPNATWNAGSTCLVTGVVSAAPTGFAQSFHHVTWDCPNQGATIADLSGTNNPVNVSGNFLVKQTSTPPGAGSGFISFSSTASGSINRTWTGNLILTGGRIILSRQNAGNASLTVNNFEINDSYLSSPQFVVSNNLNVASSSLLTVNGNLTINTSGCPAMPTIGTNLYFNSAANMSATVRVFGAFSQTICGIGANDPASAFFEYASSGSQTIIAANYPSLRSTGTGARVLSTTGEVTIRASFSPGTNSYTTTSSTVVFDGSVAQVIPALPGGANYFDLKVRNTSTKTLGASLTIDRDLVVESGVLALSSASVSYGFTVIRDLIQQGGTIDQYPVNCSDNNLRNYDVRRNFIQSAGLVTMTANTPATSNFMRFTGGGQHQFSAAGTIQYIRFLVSTGNEVVLSNSVMLSNGIGSKVTNFTVQNGAILNTGNFTFTGGATLTTLNINAGGSIRTAKPEGLFVPSGAIAGFATRSIDPTSVFSYSSGCNFPGLSGFNTFGKLEVLAGATLQLNESCTVAQVDVTGTLNIVSPSVLQINQQCLNNGLIRTESGASLLQTSLSTRTGTGNYIVQRQGNSGAYFHNFWSTPTQSAPVNLLGSPVYQYEPAMGTVTLADDDFDPGWVLASGLMAPGKGFTAMGSGLVNFQGTINNAPDGSPITVNVSRGANNVGFNLVGNPFPSAINGASFLTNNSGAIDGTVWLWDQSGLPPYSSADFATINALGATTGGGTQIPTGSIASGQGFFVHRSVSGSASIEFRNAQRTAAGNTQFFESEPIARVWFFVTTPENKYNELLIGWKGDATEGFDPLYDGRKYVGNPDVSFYSKIGDNPYAIQGLKWFDEAQIIELGLVSSTFGIHQIHLGNTESLPEGMMFFLEDTQNNTFTHLSGQNELVSFEFGPDSPENRFRLHVQPRVRFSISNDNCLGENGSIVIDHGSTNWNYVLKNSTGELIVQGVAATGEVISDQLNAGNYHLIFTMANGYSFETSVVVESEVFNPPSISVSESVVDLSSAIVEFQAIGDSQLNYMWDFGDGTEPAFGQSQIHAFNETGIFTVKLISNNGLCASETIQNIAVTTPNNPTGIQQSEEFKLVCFPNPANGFMQLIFSDEIKMNAQVEITDLAGRRILSESISIGKNSYLISTSTFQNGIYLLRIQYENSVFTNRFTIQH